MRFYFSFSPYCLDSFLSNIQAKRRTQTRFLTLQCVCEQAISEPSICRFDSTRYAKGNIPVVELREAMQQTMHRYCSVFRTCHILQRGCREMTRLYTCDLPDMCVGELIEIFHLRKRKLQYVKVFKFIRRGNKLLTLLLLDLFRHSKCSFFFPTF